MVPNRSQHEAAVLVANALSNDARIAKVSLFQGETFSLITCYLETADGFDRLRVEVHPEGI